MRFQHRDAVQFLYVTDPDRIPLVFGRPATWFLAAFACVLQVS